MLPNTELLAYHNSTKHEELVSDCFHGWLQYFLLTCEALRLQIQKKTFIFTQAHVLNLVVSLDFSCNISDAPS